MTLFYALGKRMRRQYGIGPQWLLLLCWLLPVRSWAQTNQGLVADSTELRVLRQFYASTKGDQWVSSNRTNWPTTPAAWAAATVANAATWTGIAVTNGDISTLSLDQLQGTLPSSLGLLKGLTFFNVPNSPGLGGPLPSNIGNLTNLTYLRTSNSNLSGPLPASLGNLSQLQYLYLDNSQFSGNLPATLGNLRSLLYINVGTNRFTGPIPSQLGQLTQLQFLGFGNSWSIQPGQGNAFTGGIPKEFGNLTNLTYLDFSLNPIGGTIPVELGRLTKLTFFEVDDCGMYGAVPVELVRLPQLNKLILGTINLYYRDPNRFTNLPSPSVVANLANLSLYVEYNQFEFGDLEPYFSGPGQMRTHYYSNYKPQTLAQDAQTIRAEVGHAVRLSSRIGGSHTHYQWQRRQAGQWQDVAGATDSTLVFNAVSLADTGTYRPRATNEWVTDLTLYAAPKVLRVTADEGHVPNADELRALRDLYTQTHGAQWVHHDNWPATEAAWAAATIEQAATWYGVGVAGHDVVSLGLQYQNMQGPLPRNFGDLRWLQVAYLNGNQLTGTLPTSLGQLQRLQILYFTYNQLTGPIPAGLGATALSQLGLDHNQLSGPIPPTLGQLQNLTRLYLHENQLSGPFPAFLLACRSLRAFYLGGNQLTGSVPTELVQLTQLQELGLDNNLFTGPLPADLAQLPLQALYLSTNRFTSLPSWLGQATVPGEFYVNDNELDFAALEGNFAGPDQPQPASFYYAPQFSPEGTDTTRAEGGASTQLNGQRGGSHNLYQWQRQTAATGEWVNVAGQTQPTLRWAAVTPAAAGRYRTQVTNTWVRDVTLYSREQYLQVGPPPLIARNLPDDTNRGLALVHLPQPVDSAATRPADMNFIRVWMPRVALTQAAQVSAAPVEQVSMSTQYLDGLGRPVQTVLKQASPQQRDLVQPQAYDALGREPRQYLSYPDSVGGRGGYRYRGLTQQQQFYRDLGGIGPSTQDNPTLGVARTGAAFAETQFEASPLNRVLQQGAAGEAWQLGQGHTQQRLERPNVLTDSIPYLQVGYDRRGTDSNYQGFYAAGELWGTQTTDEGGSQVLEWKDKLGQVVLKQVESSRPDPSPLAKRRWLRTAYGYDDFQRLRIVLQPEGTKRLLAKAAQTSILPFTFSYRYDGRGRQIAKLVPGQDGETLVVYDQLDRPVLSQDAQQRTRKEWSWTKYDALGRVVLSGLVSRADTMGQVRLQALATADTATAHQYEQRTTSGTYQYYTATQSFPQLGQQGFSTGQVLTATYYDDYDFDNNGTADLTYNPQSDGQFASGQAPVADALRTQGMTTRTKTRVLGVAESDATQAAWLTTTTFYDERARPVQVQTSNARKNEQGQPYVDLLTTQLNFTGQVVQSVAVHQGPTHTPVQVAEFFTYDHTGRLLTTRQQLPGETQPTLLASVQYNELGQARRKTLGTGRLKQDVDYAYNIRGWLTKLNDPAQPDPADLFNLSLHYEAGFTKGYEQYNGNLTGQTWRGRDGVQRAYGYVYDPLNRLLQGDFVARAGGSQGTLSSATAWNQELDNYRLSSVSYDDNGNINTLRRRGLLQNATSKAAKQYGAVDNLSYAYVGNRLQAVDDQVTGNQLTKPASYHGAPTSLAGDFQEASVRLSQEYLYDANGNLTQDKNKGLTGIKYNHLNLPRQIQFGAGADSVVFRYTASGQKVAKLVYQTGRTTPERTDYLGPYQYEQDSLKFFPHAEGRVLRFVSYDPAGQATVSYQREYTMKDHLGNLRLAYRLGQPRTLLATLEQDETTHKREYQQFDSLSVSPPIAVATPNAMGQYAARLNAGGSTPQPLGPFTQLGVQKGDVVTVSAFGFYPQAPDHGFFFSLASFLTSLFHPAQPAPVGLEATKRKNLPLLQFGVAAGVTTLTQTSGVPLGYLRVLVFNKDSVLVQDQTTQVQLSSLANGRYEELRTQVVLAQDGYVTAYVGNESDVDVYFDNVKVDYQPGLLVQETQYDPAGLELAGLAAPSPGIRGLNNYRFNGKEFQADLGLAWNHQDWRFFDSQLLRWHVGDPELENGQESWTPYSFGYDNAVRYADANGRCPCEAVSPGVLQQAWSAGVAAWESIPQTSPVSIGVALGAGAIAVVGTVVALNWDKLPSGAEMAEAFRAGAADPTTTYRTGTAQPILHPEVVYNGLKASNANGRVNTSASQDGIIYKRTNPKTGGKYVGQAKSDERYEKRKKEHDKSKGVRHDYEVLDKAAPGQDLDVAEEKHIRAEGGPKTNSNPNGKLENKRHQMSDERYKKATGGI